MAGIFLANRAASVKVASRCGVKLLALVICESKLRWYGHAMRRLGDGVLGEVMEMDAPGTKPRGRPKKTWMKNIEADVCEWNVLEEDVYDRVR